LYPSCRSITPAGTFEDYWAGQDKDAIRVDLREIKTTVESPTTVGRKANFL